MIKIFGLTILTKREIKKLDDLLQKHNQLVDAIIATATTTELVSIMDYIEAQKRKNNIKVLFPPRPQPAKGKKKA